MAELAKTAKRPRVVIVGGGFGGIDAAKALAAAPVDVTVIDRQNYHCFQPLLYQVATATLSPADVAWPIRGILAGHKNTIVLMAEVTGVDAANRQVLTSPLAVPYDFLVLATGSTASYFGHDAWAAVALGLKGIDDATAIRRRVLLAFERAELADDAGERQRQMTFVVIGGGPTGVEMAGAIAELARLALPLDFRRIDPRSARIVLVEAGARLLPELPERLSSYARRTLERMGVEVRTGARVTGCDRTGVELVHGRVDAATVIWAAGVVASPAASWIGAERDRAGRIRVAADLSVPGMDGVFAIGDAALVNSDGKPVPGLAPAAKQMGRYVAAVIQRRVRGDAPPPPFSYRHRGDLATIGRKAAIVKLGRLELRGFVGWVFWSVVHIYFLIGTRNRFLVAFTWLWSYVTLQHSARLITAPAPSDVARPVP